MDRSTYGTPTQPVIVIRLLTGNHYAAVTDGFQPDSTLASSFHRNGKSGPRVCGDAPMRRCPALEWQIEASRLRKCLRKTDLVTTGHGAAFSGVPRGDAAGILHLHNVGGHGAADSGVPRGTYPVSSTSFWPSGESMKSTIFRVFFERGRAVTMYTVATSG